jgi:hypothetical protein
MNFVSLKSCIEVLTSEVTKFGDESFSKESKNKNEVI